MPVLKIPIVHKFGIISHSQRLELQERLLQQTHEKENATASQARKHIRANPLEVCEKFLQRYNACSFSEQDHLRAAAERLITHSKRRAGIVTCGEGEHVDLPMAWSELAILAQCKGKLQEDCFEVLCQSLNHAPLLEENIPTLFFLAESTLYWLRTDSVNQPHLRTAEIRLLKMGFLVFVRLYFHYLVGNLNGLTEFRTRLITYLEGIHEHEALYKSYPGVLMELRFIATIGDIIVQPYKSQDKTQDAEPPAPVPLPPTVYQASQVWRCRAERAVGLQKAVIDILLCTKDISSANWVDALFTLAILGEAAKANAAVCRTLQDIARGVSLPLERTAQWNYDQEASPRKTANSLTNDSRKEVGKSVNTDDAFQQIMTGMLSDFNSVIGKTPNEPTSVPNPSTDTKSRSKRESKSRRDSSNQPGTSQRTPRMTSGRSSAFSDYGTPQSETAPEAGAINAGINTWSWETAYHYSQVLADICMHGCAAPIQKLALLGKWLDADVTTFRSGVPNYCIESCGLVDLLEFRRLEMGETDNSASHLASRGEDWSWMVRYGALSSLVHLTHALSGDKVREGMRSAAWSLIISIQDSMATDDRVAEAIRVGQVEFPDFRASADGVTSVGIWSRVSRGLTEHFILPQLPIPRSPSSLARPATSGRHRSSPRENAVSSPRHPAERRQPVAPKVSPTKPTLKDSLEVFTALDVPVTNLHARNALNLNRIVEDQWRKEMMRRQEQDEKERLRQIKLEREQEEKRMQESLERRKEKLKGRATVALGPYEIS